jgi:hypothetical protein
MFALDWIGGFPFVFYSFHFTSESDWASCAWRFETIFVFFSPYFVAERKRWHNLLPKSRSFVASPLSPFRIE